MEKFNEYNKFSLSQINKQVLEQWNRQKLFQQVNKESEGHPSFVFYEGPPSANGMPGIHHVMARTIKDLFCRYKTMQGFSVARKAGWDTHGLPVELGVEKNLGITKEDIGKKISVDDYNNACRKEVMKYTSEWTSLTNKMGYWVDTENPYITYDNKYIETVWWLLNRLYSKGFLYKGYTIQPYSPAAGTGLSTHELNQPGCYRDVKDTTATALFEMVNPSAELSGWGKTYFAAWTTTPWTLPSNTALCVGPKIKYVAVRTYNPYTAEKATIILAESRLDSYFKSDGKDLPLTDYTPGDKIIPYQIIATFTGEQLVGLKYKQLLPWVKPVAKVDDLSPAYVRQFLASHPECGFQVQNDNFVELSEKAFRVIPGDYVTTDDGTGIVHIAPTFGADDAKVASAAEIPSIFMVTPAAETRPMVDLTGKYYLLADCAPQFVEKCVDKSLYEAYQGLFVKNDYAPEFNQNGVYDKAAADAAEDLNITLSLQLKRDGNALRIEKHIHNYPHCWRTDKPILYYPLDSWFIRTTRVRERMIELNNEIKWKPASTGSGRFGKWLENLQDWNLSRSRYWGTPLPIWRTKQASGQNEEICISSLNQLYDEIEKSVDNGIMAENPLKKRGFIPGDYSKANYDRIDLHRPYVDDIILTSPSGRPMYRETDLIDVWFDSGSMPYAQLHYPFENKEAIDDNTLFPADFIAEGVDQTRGWFFTLHAIATMAFDSKAFKAVISNGLVLDKVGAKMSKRLGNAVNPFDTIDHFGADAVRWYMIANSSPWDNLKFDENGVAEVSRKLFGTIFNTYSFFSLYANIDGFDPSETIIPVSERPEIDRWIISLLNTLISQVTESLNDYEPTKAARLINDFVNDNLSNWYVRLNRKRFWSGEMTNDKLSAYQSLYECLDTVVRLMAPITPFFSDRIYQDLHPATDNEVNSVHLQKYPEADSSLIDTDLEHKMSLAQTLTSLVLSLRRKVNIKVRQPLQALMIPVNSDSEQNEFASIIDTVLAEVNVKDVKFVKNDEGVLVKRIKPNFKLLGPKFGKDMKTVANILTNLPQAEILKFESDRQYPVQIDGKTMTIDASDVEIISEDIPGWLVANEGSVTVALDITVTPELKAEGLARDIVNRIQNVRKSRNYDVTDRIALTIDINTDSAETLKTHLPYISSQTLADSLTFGQVVAPADDEIFDIDGLEVKVQIKR